MPDRATFIADHWRAYSRVNEEFAAKTVSNECDCFDDEILLRAQEAWQKSHTDSLRFKLWNLYTRNKKEK